MCFYIISNISAFESFKVAQFTSIVSVSRNLNFWPVFLRKRMNQNVILWLSILFHKYRPLSLTSIEPLEYSCKYHHIKSTEQIRHKNKFNTATHFLQMLFRYNYPLFVNMIADFCFERHDYLAGFPAQVKLCQSGSLSCKFNKASPTEQYQMIRQLSCMLSVCCAACQYISDREGMFCTRRQIAPYLSEECLSAAQFMPRLRRSERGGTTERERTRWRENTDDWLIGEEEAETLQVDAEPRGASLTDAGAAWWGIGQACSGCFGDSNPQKTQKEWV